MSAPSSPNSLEPTAGVNVKRLSKFFIAVATVVLAVIMATITFNIFQPKRQQADEPAATDVSAADGSKSLADGLDLSGLAKKKSAQAQEGASGAARGFGLAGASASNTQNQDFPPVANIPAAQTSSTQLPPAVQTWMQEHEELRKHRMKMQMEALESPLAVSLSNQPPAGTGAAGERKADARQSMGSGSSGLSEDLTAKMRSLQNPSSQYDNSERQDKEGFSSRSVQNSNWRLEYGRERGLPYEIKTGSVIPGIMITGINSDLPGRLIAQCSQHVYDTVTGRHLLIPQGSRLFGIYDARLAMGQERVLIAWNRIIFPDGSSVDLESMPGTDQGGYAGFEDQVNNHYLRIFGNASVMSLIAGGMAYGIDTLNSNSKSNNNYNSAPTIQGEMGTALASQLGQVTLQLLQQNISIKPTLEIRSGYRFNLVLVKDLVFDRPYVHGK